MGNTVDLSPLGQQTVYASQYDSSLLFPIAREASRAALGITSQLPFYGIDVWTGYELSWLNLKGKPQVAVAEFRIPCNSPFIIESKSFKLYLNSFNQTRFNSWGDVRAIIERDLSAIAGAEVLVELMELSSTPLNAIAAVSAVCVDDLDVDIESYHPNADYLICDSQSITTEVLVSHLLKSNCPVTGQPDWASVIVEYSGAKINRENFLRYVVSFREHQDFHEHCVERMFVDILSRCKPDELSVYARYTRRGGLDINPFRSTQETAVPLVGRLVRQ